MSEPAPRDDDGVVHPAPFGSEDVAPAESLVAGTIGDRCVHCGTPLSSDQRYCVVCGERRGAPRFSLPSPGADEPVTAVAGSASRPPRTGPRLGIGAVIAGVATLLLAMLVGVLIGHNTASGTRTVASRAPSITVEGGGSSAPAASSRSTVSSPATSTPSKRGHATAKPSKTPAVARKTAAKEQSAASKVLGGKSTPPATVTVGQTGSGAGYSKKSHKFNGSFFGQ